MKHTILLLVLTCALWCCSKDEDVTPSNVDRNMFDMPDFSSEEEMKIRRDFYENTTCYLIFNDSLYYRALTTPGSSEPECVVLDLKYQITGYSENILLRHTYLKNIQDKELAAKFAKEEILPRLIPALYPYTFFMVDQFFVREESMWSDDYGPETERAAYTGYNATLVAYNNYYQMDEAARNAYKRAIMSIIMAKNHTQIADSEYDSFYQYSQDTYGKYPDYDDTPLEVGFLETFRYDFGRSFYSKKNDLLAYVMEIFKLTGEEFNEKYDKEKYPLVHLKKEALVKIFENLGVKVY
ncbi:MULTISPECIES: hypothetical protein [Butyricimonas]|uniref:hypothetical protein n=1 Tax=Butyricimonas TaxID=574697 RepID=UPI001D08DBD2|nr:MULTISPECIES: hypothetical protein [Butyricimonas]MCB6973509.1 hypothetical protein [Butyricimonas synergistica]MCG4520387.1 hypothetical protein [Butyricimonas sp. DFI.6.44]